MVNHLFKLIATIKVILLTGTSVIAGDFQINGEWQCEELVHEVRIANDSLIFEYKDKFIVAALIHQQQLNDSETHPIHDLIFQNTSDDFAAYFFVNQTNTRLHLTVLYNSLAMTKKLTACDKVSLSFQVRK